MIDVTATGKGCGPASEVCRELKTAGFPAIGPLGLVVEGDDWAHMEALDPDAGYWARRFAQLVNWRARGEKAVIEPSSLSGGRAARGNRAAWRASALRLRGRGQLRCLRSAHS